MDDTEDDARYPPNTYGVSEGYGSFNRQKLSSRNAGQNVNNGYLEEDDVDDEEEVEDDEEDDDNRENGVQRLGRDEYGDDNEEVEDEDEDDDDDDDDYGDMQRHPKKRKLKSLLLSYEFAPRVPAPSAGPVPVKPSFGGRNSVADWSEHETFILLEAWGDKFLQHGRKSLRSEEWQEVAEKVSKQSKIDRTDTQCRNRLDTLKKKYKKEKAKSAETVNFVSKWVYFQKMDMLMSSPPQQTGLSCGVDSGEYVFMNPGEYLNRSNGLDEMKDSPGISESAEAEDDSEGLPPKSTKRGRDRGDGASFKLLADSIEKFSEIYEKIENSKRQQMLELEKMRMDFHRELELQKRQILERAQAEIAKIRQGEDEDNDASAENISR